MSWFERLATPNASRELRGQPGAGDPCTGPLPSPADKLFRTCAMPEA